MVLFQALALCIVALLGRATAVDYYGHVETQTDTSFIINKGDHIYSSVGYTKLELQIADGNFVLYYDDSAVWSSSTSHEGVEYLEISIDGNLMAKGSSDTVIWQSGTGSGVNIEKQPYRLLVFYKCACLMDSDYNILWNEGPCNDFDSSTLYFDHVSSPVDGSLVLYHAGIYSLSMNTFLLMQTDGNLVLYNRNSEGSGGDFVWASGTNEGDFVGEDLIITTSGNMVVRDINQNEIWETGTNSGINPHHLVVTDGCTYLMDNTYNVLWNEGNCISPYPTFVLPTPSPTAIPTPAPAPAPTSSPTAYPTLRSTPSPSTKPTPLSTLDHTLSPTPYPTWMNTPSPTPIPTDIPTYNPISSPTTFPTAAPSHQPNKAPTKSPTVNPSNNPTNIPTEFPTKNPTTAPTGFPTKPPTTPSPTIPGTMTCGEEDIGAYNGEILTFMVAVDHYGDMIFDASGSLFEVTAMEAFNGANKIIVSDYDQDEILILTNISPDVYKFKIYGGTGTGLQYNIQTICTSNSPTPAQTTNPTPIPTPSPTPSPTHPGDLTCTNTHSNGAYTDGTLEFTVHVSYAADVIFDASNSDFTVTSISVVDENESVIDSTNAAVLTLSNINPAIYTFALTGSTSGAYNVMITCISDAPTSSPTYIPTNEPTASPTQSPTDIPTQQPSKPTISPSFYPTSEPTIATLSPTISPTDLRTTIETQSVAEAEHEEQWMDAVIALDWTIKGLAIMCIILLCTVMIALVALIKYRKRVLDETVTIIVKSEDDKGVVNIDANVKEYNAGSGRDLLSIVHKHNYKMPAMISLATVSTVHNAVVQEESRSFDDIYIDDLVTAEELLSDESADYEDEGKRKENTNRISATGQTTGTGDKDQIIYDEDEYDVDYIHWE